MGLPCSSISQAQKVEVWTWQGGPESALYSYLDVDEISNGELALVPEPEKKSVPKEWLKAGINFGASGTLVVWSRMSRCVWKTARTIIDNSELLVGRIYRRFITDGTTRIRMAAFDVANPAVAILDKDAQPNDPLYLTDVTSCPAPFSGSE